MDQGHEDKRPRLSTGWPAGPSHHGHGVSLPHPGPPLTTSSHHHSQPLPPPNSSQYSPSPHLSHPPPHSFPPRPQEFAQSHTQQQQPPPPPPSQQQHQQQQQQQQQQQPPPPQPLHFDERRQHEPERFPPTQDHRHHPTPSPAHQAYPSSAYPPPGRDSMVKRESDDIKLPQIGRPNSTGNGPEQASLPPPPPPAHGHPPPAHMEERRHMSYGNGPAPPMYRHPSYPPPPQTPISHPGPPPSPYEQNSMYAPPMGQDGAYPPFTIAAASGKRKSQRASQACESCRSLKAKCDENKPCKNCVDKNIVCQYRDPAPKQQDKATQDILDAVHKMLQSDRREMLAEMKDLMKAELRDIRSERRTNSAHSSNGPSGPPDFGRDLLRAVSPVQMTSADETVSSSPGNPRVNGLPDPEDAAVRMRQLENEEETEEPPGDPIRPEAPPFPHDHTTPAGRLLRWPAIRDLITPLLKAENVKWLEAYPQRWEESRGQLPLFGRGEASVTRPADPATNDYVDIPDDNSQVGDHQSPSAGTDWGPIGGMSPPGGPLPADMRANASRVDGALDFDEKKVWEYVASYKDHIQNMHPLIPPRDLDAMVVSFLSEVGAPQKSRGIAKFANQQEATASTSLDYDRKRKRSPAPNGIEAGPMPKRQKPQRSIKHALVLLVLALGKISMVRDRKLPDPIEKEKDYNPVNNGSPIVRNGLVTSPTHGSPPSSALSQSPGQAGLPSPKDIERSAASRRSSVQTTGIQAPTSAASPAPPKRNYEVIPGLEYFAYATDILGNQFGGYKLNHAQAHILASLYYAQLGRVIPSFRHVRFACQVIIDKLQPAMARLNQTNLEQRVVEDDRDNKHLVCFWSCLQLESDILAELNLLPSGILQYESIMPYPGANALSEKLGFSADVIGSYLCQLYLRKRMNEISGRMYNPQRPLTPEERLIVTADLEERLLVSPHLWAHQFVFDLQAPPATDILNARFRAKFWGANVITYRPYIQSIMEWSYARRHPEQVRENGFHSGSVPSDATTPSEISPIVIKYARKGIDAVIKSTEAFHGLRDRRFVITNVFGTAHAQWGNLITLAAAYEDPVLGPYIDENHLRHLFRKTIDFFEIVASDSSSLAVDLRILKRLQERLPAKKDLQYGSNAFFTPLGPPVTQAAYMSNGTSTPAQLVSGMSVPRSHSNTPSDMGQGHPTPMDFS